MINVGCGMRPSPQPWLNLDLRRYPGVDYSKARLIVTEALSYLRTLPDGCVRAITAEQFLEHLEYPVGAEFLRECYRVLEPGGSLWLTIPDFQAHISDYVNRERKVPCAHAIEGPFRPEVNLLIQTVYAEPWGHRSFYDAEMLDTVIRNAGFSRLSHAWPDGANVTAKAWK